MRNIVKVEKCCSTHLIDMSRQSKLCIKPHTEVAGFASQRNIHRSNPNPVNWNCHSLAVKPPVKATTYRVFVWQWVCDGFTLVWHFIGPKFDAIAALFANCLPLQQQDRGHVSAGCLPVDRCLTYRLDLQELWLRCPELPFIALGCIGPNLEISSAWR